MSHTFFDKLTREQLVDRLVDMERDYSNCQDEVRRCGEEIVDLKKANKFIGAELIKTTQDYVDLCEKLLEAEEIIKAFEKVRDFFRG